MSSLCMPLLPTLQEGLRDGQEVKKYIQQTTISISNSDGSKGKKKIISLKRFRQYDLDGNQRDSSRLEERFGYRIDSKEFNKLVTIMKGIRLPREVSKIFEGTVLQKFICEVRLGDRTAAAIAENFCPSHYTYRAKFLSSGIIGNLYDFEVGLNLGTSGVAPNIIDDNNINFCIKVSRKDTETIECMERCKKKFREESYEFNIHLTSLDDDTKSHHDYVNSIEDIVDLMDNRDYNVSLPSILKCPADIIKYLKQSDKASTTISLRHKKTKDRLYTCKF